MLSSMIWMPLSVKFETEKEHEEAQRQDPVHLDLNVKRHMEMQEGKDLG